MAESTANLQGKMDSATDLKAVVRTMKAMAAANITQYENAVLSLDDYYHTVQLGLMAYFRQIATHPTNQRNAGQRSISSRLKSHENNIGIIVFGSDQGLVGQFNDRLLAFLNEKLLDLPTQRLFFAVGERIETQLEQQQFPLGRSFVLPSSIDSISALVTDILIEIEQHRATEQLHEVYLFFNRTVTKAHYEPHFQRILPFDKQWQDTLMTKPWPTANLPQLLVNESHTFSRLIGEYIFSSVFRACTESLASENASRLLAMQRAEKNIEELQDQMHRHFHRQRQSAIDEELADLIGGFEALSAS